MPTGDVVPRVHRCSVQNSGCGHMYGSARGRQILQYKINPNPNPNPNTNPSSPYCIMRFIFGSRVHVPLCKILQYETVVEHLLKGAILQCKRNIYVLAALL